MALIHKAEPLSGGNVKVASVKNLNLTTSYQIIASNLPKGNYFCVIKVISGAGAYGMIYFDANDDGTTASNNAGTSFQTNSGNAVPVGNTFIVTPYGYGNLRIRVMNSNWINTVVDIDVYEYKLKNDV